MPKLLKKDCAFPLGNGKFTEYRGRVRPHCVTLKIGRPGDVYLDLEELKVWYYTDQWILWDGLDRKHIHPTDKTRFLAPGRRSFNWENLGLYAQAKVDAREIFGRKYSPKDVIAGYYPSEIRQEGSSRKGVHSLENVPSGKKMSVHGLYPG
jgi:hypothetical protein